MAQIAIDPRVLVRDIKGVQTVLLIGKWNPNVSVKKSVYEQLYVWLLENEYVTNEQFHSIHNCLYLGMKAKAMVDRYERKRIRKFVRPNEVERALSWSDLGSGPMDEICGVKIKGNTALVFKETIKDQLGHYCFEYAQRQKAKEISRIRELAAGDSFYLWMKCQEGRDDGVGDLISDIINDRGFPRNGDTYFIFEKYINENMSLPSAALDRLADAWIEYMNKYSDRVIPGVLCSVCEEFVGKMDLCVVINDSHSVEFGHEACLNESIRKCIAKYNGNTMVCDDILTHFTGYPPEYLNSMLQPLILGAVIHEKADGLVYFIQSDETKKIKIGYTAGPIENRLRNLQTAQSGNLRVLASIPGGKDKEAALHTRFELYREVGEWFFPGPELVAYISEIRSA